MSHRADSSGDLEILAARAQVALNEKLGRTSPAPLLAISRRHLSRGDVEERRGAPPLTLMGRHDAVVGAESSPNVFGGRALAHVAGQLMRGDDVLELQRRLKLLGYEVGSLDGLFGPVTERAVRSFQAQYEVTNDGVVGDVSVRVLLYLDQHRIDAENPATAEQMHLIGHVVRIQSTGLVLIDLISGLRQVTDPESHRLADRLTASLGLKVKREVEAQTNMQCWVFHSADYQSNEESFAEFANEIRAPLIISLSVIDDAGEPGGCATYYFGDHDKFHSHIGRPLARFIHDAVLRNTGWPDRGLRVENSALFTRAKLPTIRVEFGNLHSADDRQRLLRGGQILDRFASGIAAGIRSFYLLGQKPGPGQALNVGGGASRVQPEARLADDTTSPTG